MPYTDFHYTPTGTGVISGKEVLEQTEDAINDLGGQISGDVQTAIDTANNALNVANTASTDAQNAVNTANTAYTTATNAQNAANAAQNTASNALTAAQNAQNDVNALGNRVTTAENNITQNTTDISGLTTRMGTAEGNITNLQNDVVTAQGTATSAQNTATLARGQAYVVRYANVAVSDNSTVPYANLNNVDNIKANDLLLDTNGKLYQISSVDTVNETVSVTIPLTQLAVDSNVMHLSGNESASGDKNFQGLLTTIPNASLWPTVLNTTDDVTYLGRSVIHIEYKSSGQLTNLSSGAWGVAELGTGCFFFRMNNGQDIRFKNLATGDVNRIPVVSGANRFMNDVLPDQDNTYSLGSSSLRWATINGLNPSSLSMPDLSNGIDISSYIPALDSSGNTQGSYTPSVNGFIVFRGVASTGGCSIVQGNMGNNTSYITDPQTSNKMVNNFLPVVKDNSVVITVKGLTSIELIYFYPCQGNV